MKKAYFHGGFNADKTGKFSHAVVAWRNSTQSAKSITKVLNPEQAQKCFADYIALYQHSDFTIGIYPYVAD